MPEYDGLATRFFRALAPTFRYWMQTEVHVFAFSIAANVLLSFFPFLIVALSLSKLFFDYQTAVTAIDFALRDYFPSVFSQFVHNNIPANRRAPELISILLLLFTANGIFEPLEVALNHVWGIHKNRSFVRNQLVSLALILGCGGLSLFSLWLTALNSAVLRENRMEAMLAGFWLKLAAVPLTAVILLLIYRFLPNGKPPFNRAIPAAVGVSLLLEGLKYVAALAWPWFGAKLRSEYGVFQFPVTLVFLSFFASMIVLAGAEWAARGHRFDSADALVKDAVAKDAVAKEGTN